MPIYEGQLPIIRIKQGETDIVEVYKGENLVWGLYQITYHNPIDSSTGGISDYVWAYPNYPEVIPGDYTLLVPADITAAQNTYKTHCDGWYRDKSLVTYIPAITMDFHQDFELYSKWRQRRYFYGGTVRYYTWDPSGGGGSVPSISTPPRPNDSAYPWSGSAALSMPNCTWYVYYRVQNAGATAPMKKGFGTACNWIYSGQPGYRELGDGWSALEGETNFKPGDIICYDEISSGDGGHVAFVEGNGSITGSWWTNLSGQRATYNAGGLAEWILDGAGSSYAYRYWHNDRSASSEFGGRIQGVLRYNGWSGGGGGWDPEPWPVSKTLCPDQDNPAFPNADSIKRGETNPYGEYRPSEWSTDYNDDLWKVYYTEVRSYDYNTNNWSSWTSEVGDATQTQNSKTNPYASFLTNWSN